MIGLAWGKYNGLANIGIACGPSNLVVLDEDQHGEIERWCVTYGITLPDTYTVSTGRGRHLYFRWDHTAKRIGNSPKAMTGFKVDVRGDGGFAVAEGSRHKDGTVYTGNDHPIADLPDEVAKLLLADSATTTTKSETTESTWEKVETERIDYPHRHNALVAYAGRLRKSGLDYDEVEPIFRERWFYCEQPEGQIPEARYHGDIPYPVTWDEAKAKLADVFQRYARGNSGDDNHFDESFDSTSCTPTEFSPESPGELTRTDSGSAAELVEQCDGRHQYVPKTARWLRWDGMMWSKESDDGATEYERRKLADRIPIPKIDPKLYEAAGTPPQDEE